MSNEDLYRHHAAECLRMANETCESSTKAALVEMAQTWIRLAEQAAKNAQTDLVYETPPLKG